MGFEIVIYNLKNKDYLLIQFQCYCKKIAQVFTQNQRSNKNHESFVDAEIIIKAVILDCDRK